MDNPEEPTNGRLETIVRRGYYEFEDVVSFECIPGYDLIGDNTITCQSDGQWSADEPICQSMFELNGSSNKFIMCCY